MKILMLGNRALDDLLNVEEKDLRYVLPNIFHGITLNGHVDCTGLSRLEQKRLKNFLRIYRIVHSSGHDFSSTCHYPRFIEELDRQDPDAIVVYKVIDWKRYFLDLDYNEKVRQIYSNVLESHLGMLMPEAHEIISARAKQPKVIILEPDLSQRLSDKYIMHRSIRESQIVAKVKKRFPGWKYSTDKPIENVTQSLEHLSDL